jgi:hypothetical protein
MGLVLKDIMAQTLLKRTESLIGFTFGSDNCPTTNDLDDYLAEGISDVRAKTLRVFPERKSDFGSEYTVVNGNGLAATSSSHVLGVMRESGIEGQLQAATRISSSLRYSAQDPASMHFRSVYNPAWYYTNNKVYVLPEPGSSGNSAIISHISTDYSGAITALTISSAGDTGGTGTADLVIANSNGGTGFTGTATVASGAIIEVNIITPGIGYSGNPACIIAGVVSNGVVTSTSGGTSIVNTASTLNGVIPFDMEQLVIEYAAMRAILSRMGKIIVGYTAYNAPTLTTNNDDESTTPLTNASISTLLSSGVGLEYDFDVDNIDVTTWFQEAGDMISRQEDLELAGKQLEKISTFMTFYQAEQKNQDSHFQSAWNKLMNEYNWLAQRWQLLNGNYTAFFTGKQQQAPQPQQERRRAK